MNPLRIEQYGNTNKFTAFKGNKFVGWIKRNSETSWGARPANQWLVYVFETKAKAIRYLIASTKK